MLAGGMAAAFTLGGLAGCGDGEDQDNGIDDGQQDDQLDQDNDVMDGNDQDNGVIEDEDNGLMGGPAEEEQEAQ